MKTKAIICGVVVAAISTFVISQARAQVQDTPAVKIISTDRSDVIKIIYAYNSSSPVVIRFLSSEGLVYEEQLAGGDTEKGFSKKYDVEKMKNGDLWIEVNGQEVAATFKLSPATHGKWSAQLQKVTHNFPTLALN